MSETKTVQSSGGIGFFGLLALVFITLKLTGYITWSWWWVLAPLWMPITIIVIIAAFVFMGAMFVGLIFRK